MKRYLLDTALVAGYLHGRQKAVELITPWVTKSEAATSMLVYAEVVEYLQGFSTLHLEDFFVLCLFPYLALVESLP